MNIYWNFALYFLIFQPVVVLSEGPRNVHFSLSQISLLLNKMDEFLASKCIMNKSAFLKMNRKEKFNWEKKLKQSILKLKCSELETLFGQIDIKIDPMEIDDQQQPSTMSAKAFMKMLLEKMWENVPKVPQVPNPEQNQLLLRELIKISSNFAEKFLQIARNNNVLSKFGDNCSLINWAFYEELEWKFNKVADIIGVILNEDFKSSYTYWFKLKLNKYFNVNISWHEPDENITAWKIDVQLNEQRFVQSLLNYYKDCNMEMVLKNGFNDFLLTFPKNEKSWEIVMPSAIEKMKAEIEKQIKSLNDLNSVEQNRLFLLSMHKIALHFVQNLFVNGLLNDDERKGFVIGIKNKMNSIFKKDLKYFEGIEQYYYGIETGQKLKEILGKFKNEQKNQNQLVSIEQIGSNYSILADFVEEKLADSIGDLLREGESLALLDWCHKNHKQISMTELAYIVENLRELLFPDVPIVEWERKREQTLRVDLNQLKNRLDKMPYDQILSSKYAGEFLPKLFDGFDFIASSHLEISEIDRKLILCFELSKIAFELLEKCLHEFNPTGEANNIQQKLFHSKFYEELKQGFNFFRSDADSELTKTTNVFVNLRSILSYFQADFKYENVIASEFRMKFQIKLEAFEEVIRIIGQFIYQKCGKHLWNLVDKMDELTNCSNRLDFAEFGRSFGTNRSFMLLVVNVLECEEAANGADKWICPYNDQIFEQITGVEIKIKRFILKGLLQFGRLFMETFGIFAMETRFHDDWRTMIWKNISITFTSYNNLHDQMEAIEKSLKEAGLIEAMGDEIVENRDSLLAKAGVKRKNISRSNQLKKN